MKSELKKAASIIAAAVMVFSIYSCRSDSGDKKSSSSTADVTTTSAEDTSSKTYNDSESADTTTSEPYEDDEDEIDVSSLKYDFSGLKSEKYINTFINGRYKMVGSATQTAEGQEAYIDINHKKALLQIRYLGKDFKMFIDDGIEYTIMDKSYYKSDAESNSIGSFAPFKNCGYIESGEKQIDGTTYYYDEYYDVDSKLSMKLLVDKDGKLYGMEQNNVTTAIDEFSSEFDDSVFNVLEGCQEATEEEFMNILMGSTGDTAPAE